MLFRSFGFPESSPDDDLFSLFVDFELELACEESPFPHTRDTPEAAACSPESAPSPVPEDPGVSVDGETVASTSIANDSSTLPDSNDDSSPLPVGRDSSSEASARSRLPTESTGSTSQPKDAPRVEPSSSSPPPAAKRGKKRAREEDSGPAAATTSNKVRSSGDSTTSRS